MARLRKSGKALAALAVLFNLVAAGARADDGTVSETLQGPVKGVAHDAYVEYLGIPYAKPPVGELRWKPPVEADNHDGVLAATKFSSKCVQMDGKSVIGSEDCLYLNV